MLGLIIVDDEAGVDHTGNPAEERQQQAKNETQEPAGHEHGDGRKDDAKKVAERFQRILREASRDRGLSAINDWSAPTGRPSPTPARFGIRRSCAIQPGYSLAWSSGRFAFESSPFCRWRNRQKREHSARR